MPPTEFPPNPAPAGTPPPNSSEPVKIVTRRFGELDHTELVHLLDSLEGDQSRSRFRESIYISIIFYLILAWLLVYGPRYIFHQGRIVPTAASIREKDRLTQLDLQRELAKAEPPKSPKSAPKLDRRAIEQLQSMQRANDAARAARQQKLPDAPQPQPTPAPPPPPVQAQTPPQPAPPLPAPLPRAPTPQQSIPDAPHPAFQTPAQNPGQSVEQAARDAGRLRGNGRGTDGPGSRLGTQGAGTGAEILSDTRGVDFNDYIKRLLRIIKAQWLPLIPEECYPPLSKEGTTLIRFTIQKNGDLADPHLEDSTHDRAIDRAAWGAITSVGQFPPLPAAFSGSNIELRIQFNISRNASDAQ